MKSFEKSFKEAALAVVAAENGIISPQKLVHVFSEWVNSPGVSIRKKLEEALPEENRELIKLLGFDEFEAETQNKPVEALLESVNRIKEQTKIAVSASAEPDSNTSTFLITDETPGRYEIKEELARGGAGRVMVVVDRHVGREIAMKELLLDLRDARDGITRKDPHSVSLRNRFLREARVTGQLEHPSIVSVYEIGRHSDGVFYYTMRMVKGRTLNQAIKLCSSLEERLELLPHFYNICNAVAYAHSKGVINRDLKPANVMIGEFGETVVLDWGLAKIKGQEDDNSDKFQKSFQIFMDADVGKTVVGYAIGTPSYMPPEQAEGKIAEIDEVSDIYSLGAILYQILTGRPPYSGKNASEILRKVVNSDLQKATFFDSNIPPELAAVAHKAMSKKKKGRYASVPELIEEISSYMSGGGVKVYKYSFMESFKKFALKNKTAFISAILIIFMLSMSTTMIAWYYNREIDAKNNAKKEKIISQYRTAQAFNEKATRLEAQKQFLSSRIYAAASLYFNPANEKSPEYAPWFRKKFKDANLLSSDAVSRFYEQHLHRGALLETGIDTDCNITAFALSNATSFIFAGCKNGEIRVFSLENLKEKKKFKIDSEVIALDLTTDGKFALFAELFGTIAVANLESGEMTTLSQKVNDLKCAKFSPDGSKIVACSLNSSLNVIDLASEGVTKLKGHPGSVNDALFTDEKTVVSASSDGTIRVWDLENGEERIIYESDKAIVTLARAKQSETIFAGKEDGSMLLFSKEDYSVARIISHHENRVASIDVSPDELLFVTSEKEKKSVVWDMEKMIPLFAVEGHRGSMVAALFDSSSKKIVTAGREGFIRIWQCHDRKQIKTLSHKLTEIKKGVISKSGQIAFLLADNSIAIQDSDGANLKKFSLETQVFDIDISSDGKLIAAACWDTTVKILNSDSGEVLKELKGNQNAVSTVKFSPNGNFTGSAGRDGTLSLFSLKSGERVAYKCKSGGASELSFSFDGNLVAGICDNGDLPILKVPSMEVVKVIKNKEKRAKSIAWTADNKKLFVSYSEHLPEIIEIESGERVVFSGRDTLTSLTAVSNDGNFGAETYSDSFIQIWDLANQKPYLSIKIEKKASCLIFEPNDNTLGVCDGEILKFFPLSIPDVDKTPLSLLEKMEKEAGMKLKDFYLEAKM
ncbi:MAG: WD40 repeat domain-containing serine/threonine-protein kinase [bacterium]